MGRSCFLWVKGSALDGPQPPAARGKSLKLLMSKVGGVSCSLACLLLEVYGSQGRFQPISCSAERMRHLFLVVTAVCQMMVKDRMDSVMMELK